MKTAAATLKKSELLTTCCKAGFTKMVIPLNEYLTRIRGGEVAPHVWNLYWIPVQTCTACGKECEVEMQTPKQE